MDPITPANSGLSSLSDLAAASAAAASRVNPTPGTFSQSDSDNGSNPTDAVQISLKGTLATKYVQEVRAVAPLDQQTINQLKAAIAKGNYPPPALIQGLINLVGASFPPVTSE